MNLDDAITNGTLTRYRNSGSYVRGRWVAGTATTATTPAAAQPDFGALIRQNRDGAKRKQYFIKVVVPDETFDLRSEDQFGEEAADEITHEEFPGERFRVTAVKDYTRQDILPHWQVYATRIDEAVKT